MSDQLVYFDQNIVGLVLKHGTLPTLPGCVWTYSKEHFAEIRRSSDAEQYLSVLENSGAKLLDLTLDSEWKITGDAQLIYEGTPIQHYEAYIDAVGDDSVEDIFDPLQVWLNGGGNEDLLKGVPEQLSEQVLSLTEGMPESEQLNKRVEILKPELDGFVGELINNGNDISKTRKAIGGAKGAIGSVEDENPIQKIWKIIGPNCGGVSCDQFFGFDPMDKQGYEAWPVYLGIGGCCAVMDIIGYQAEKKCRKIEKLPNVNSDAGHISMGAFCSAIVSADKRLIKRAKAIYRYKNISTATILVE